MYCPRFIHSLYCDDVRHEFNGKMTLVGTYQGELNVQSVDAAPVVLPKICVVVTAQTPKEQPFEKLKFKLLRDDEVIREVDLPPDMVGHRSTADSSKFQMYGMVMELQSFQIFKNCVVRVRVETESEELWASGLQINLVSPDNPIQPEIGQVTRI